MAGPNSAVQRQGNTVPKERRRSGETLYIPSRKSIKKTKLAFDTMCENNYCLFHSFFRIRLLQLSKKPVALEGAGPEVAVHLTRLKLFSM